MPWNPPAVRDPLLARVLRSLSVWTAGVEHGHAVLGTYSASLAPAAAAAMTLTSTTEGTPPHPIAAGSGDVDVFAAGLVRCNVSVSWPGGTVAPTVSLRLNGTAISGCTTANATDTLSPPIFQVAPGDQITIWAGHGSGGAVTPTLKLSVEWVSTK